MAASGVPYNVVALMNGPQLLGTLFGYGLLGILVVQVYMYHQGFPNDPVWTKVLVWTVFIADIILTILPTIIIWRSLISGWGDLATIGVFEWPFIGMTMTSGYVTTSIHTFFSWRIWKLCKSCVLPCVVVAISFVAWAMQIFCSIQGVLHGTAGARELRFFFVVWLVGTAFCDIAITVTLVYILLTGQSRTGFKGLSNIIRRLIQLTVETAMITAIGAISMLVLFIVFPHNNIHHIPFLMLAKLYSNSLLTTLNARRHFNWADTPISLPFWEDQFQTTVARDGRMFGIATRISNGVYIPSFTGHLETGQDHCGLSSEISLGDEKGV